MKWTTVREAKNKLSEFLKYAEKDDIVITRNGKPTAIIHHVDEDELMDYLVEHSPRFIKMIESQWRDYLKHGGVPLEVLEKEVKRKRGRRF